MFTAEERMIYAPESDLGVAYGRFDPLAVRRALVLGTKGRLNDLIDLFEQRRQTGRTSDDGTPEFEPLPPDPLGQAAAEGELAVATRGAFGLLPVTTPNGATDAEAIDLLYHFLDWLGKASATAAGSPNTSPCVEPAG